MSMKISPGLADAMLGTTSLKGALTGMKLYIYAGTEPATAADALGGATLLCTIAELSTGNALQFGVPSGGLIEKLSTQDWSGVNAASGAATFCRLQLPADTGLYSATAPRIQGDVGVIGKFCNLSSIDLVAGATQTVEYLAISQPLG